MTDAGAAPSARPLSSSNKGLHERTTTMTLHYISPGLDAELAYRREVLKAAGRGTRTRRSAAGSAAGGGRTDRARPALPICRRSVPRSSTCHAGTTRHWWAGPRSSPACWRMSNGRGRAVHRGPARRRRRGRQDPAARRADRPRRRARHAGAHRPLRRPRRRRPALPAVRRPAPPRGHRPGARAGVRGQSCARRPPGRPPGRAPAGSATRRGPRPRPPAAEPGRPAAGRRRAAAAVRVGRRSHLRAGRGRPAAARAGGPALGRPVQP